MSEHIIETEVCAGTPFVPLGGIDKLREEIVRCRECKHGHITIDGKHCKWCDLLATHDPDGDGDPPNGYDPEPYFDADFFCAWGERRTDHD